MVSPLVAVDLLKNWLGLEDHSIGISFKICNSLVEILTNLYFPLLLVLLLSERNLLIGVDFS